MRNQNPYAPPREGLLSRTPVTTEVTKFSRCER